MYKLHSAHYTITSNFGCFMLNEERKHKEFNLKIIFLCCSAGTVVLLASVWFRGDQFTLPYEECKAFYCYNLTERVLSTQLSLWQSLSGHWQIHLTALIRNISDLTCFIYINMCMFYMDMCVYINMYIQFLSPEEQMWIVHCPKPWWFHHTFVCLPQCLWQNMWIHIVWIPKGLHR